MSVQVTLVGNATADPELRFTPKGDAQATFTVAVNERIKQGTEWVDGDPTYYQVVAWRKIGEQAAEHIRKGTRCIVTGKLQGKPWETRDGQKRVTFEVTADDIGLSIRKMEPGTRQAAPAQPHANPDPWNAPQDDSPPF